MICLGASSVSSATVWCTFKPTLLLRKAILIPLTLPQLIPAPEPPSLLSCSCLCSQMVNEISSTIQIMLPGCLNSSCQQKGGGGVGGSTGLGTGRQGLQSRTEIKGSQHCFRVKSQLQLSRGRLCSFYCENKTSDKLRVTLYKWTFPILSDRYFSPLEKALYNNNQQRQAWFQITRFSLCHLHTPRLSFSMTLRSSFVLRLLQ